MNRERDVIRKNNFHHALKKQRISREIYGTEWFKPDELNRYSKNKIFCSCPLCRGESWSYGANSKKQKKINVQKQLDELEYEKDEDLIFDF